MDSVVSRRSFYRKGAEAVLRAFLRREEPERSVPAMIRPPGTVPDSDFSACAGCRACATACPKDAIRIAGPELGVAATGTPFLVPEERPCWMCAELPCIGACERGVLRPLAAAEIRLGLPVLLADRCYSAGGSICETCQDGCPARPRLVRVGFGERPQFDYERCTGCGVCAWLCPADALRVAAQPTQGNGTTPSKESRA